jgi:hypothetical protein
LNEEKRKKIKFKLVTTYQVDYNASLSKSSLLYPQEDHHPLLELHNASLHDGKGIPLKCPFSLQNQLNQRSETSFLFQKVVYAPVLDKTNTGA